MSRVPASRRTEATTGQGDWVWDCSALLHHARADRCGDLWEIVRGRASRHLVTESICQELRKYDVFLAVEAAGWVVLDDPDGDLRGGSAVFLELADSLDVRGLHNLGEATVLTVVEMTGATAVVDDRDAYSVAKRRNLPVIRTLRLIGESVDRADLNETSAQAWVRELADSGARLPPPAVDDFAGWWRRSAGRL